MNTVEIVRQKMYDAMKQRDKKAKDAYAMLFDQLKKKEIDVRHELSEEEAMSVIVKMVKQCKDSIASVPEGTVNDFVEKAKYELSVYEQFLPQMMSEEEIVATIRATMAECGIDTLTTKEKGMLMKSLMPKVKGKADGKLVADLVNKMMLL